MATQQSATVLITNNSGGNAWILLFHSNSSNGTQSGNWTAAPGQTVGPLTVYFETGLGTGSILDYWSVLIQVQDGPAPGFYVSRALMSIRIGRNVSSSMGMPTRRSPSRWTRRNSTSLSIPADAQAE